MKDADMTRARTLGLVLIALMAGVGCSSGYREMPPRNEGKILNKVYTPASTYTYTFPQSFSTYGPHGPITTTTYHTVTNTTPEAFALYLLVTVFDGNATASRCVEVAVSSYVYKEATVGDWYVPGPTPMAGEAVRAETEKLFSYPTGTVTLIPPDEAKAILMQGQPRRALTQDSSGAGR